MHCSTALSELLSEVFWVSHEGYIAGLVAPEQLNGYLMRLKRESVRFPKTLCQIFIGREVYSEAEVVSSYWSAIELGKTQTSGGIFHYDRERSTYKTEWDLVQNLKNRMVSDFEGGRFQEIDRYMDELNAILNSYDSKDQYYFYSNIISKLVKYFELEHSGISYHLIPQNLVGQFRYHAKSDCQPGQSYH